MLTRPSRIETLRTLRIANADVAFSTAFNTLVGGTFLVGFVKLLGGSDIWIGVLAAVPSLLGVLQIPGAIWGRRYGSFKRFVGAGGLGWRLFYLPIAFLPLLAWPNETRLWLLAICIAIASASVFFVNSIYNDWLAELVPASGRGWYFSQRNAIATVVGAVIGAGGGFLLDRFRSAGHDPAGFAVIFGLGVCCSAISFAFFLRMRDIPRESPIKQSLIEGIKAIRAPFKDREYRKVLLFLAASVFAQMFAGNLFSAFALESLKLPFLTIQLMAVMQAVGIVASSKLWGYLSDKYGNKPVLVLLGIGLSLTPVMWLFARSDDLMYTTVMLLIGHVYSGFIWGGVTVCQFNLVLATANQEDRANYIGAALAVQGLVGGISPLAGASVMSLLRSPFSALVAYKVLFGVVCALRFLAVFLLFRVREEGSMSFSTTVKHLRNVTPRGYLAMRSLRVSKDPRSREQAIEAVGEQHFSLAAEEIVAALHDPSPSVRRQAARSLARLRDPRGAEALEHQLRDHPDLVEEETIEALGELGGPSALPLLLDLMASPRPMIRRAVAKALGKIGGTAATPALMEAAAQSLDPDLRRASLQALRNLEAREAGQVISDALTDAHPSVRIAAAEAVGELEIMEARDNLRRSLEWFDDEASSEVAYALGAVGRPEDLPALLTAAAKSRSIITRRRCLLGVARLLTVEQESYRLLLKEEMSRDRGLVEHLRPAIKHSDRVQVALERYGNGDEPGALKALAAAFKAPVLQVLAEHHVDEAFVVAACLVAKLSEMQNARDA